MNYHKKLQDLGFRRHTSLVIANYTIHEKKNPKSIEGYYIKESSQYFREKFNEVVGDKYTNLKPNTTFGLHNMSMRISQEDAKKFQTYRWKISEEFSLYITIFKETFSCFGLDSNAIDTEDKYTIHKNDAFTVCNGTLNPDFWKEILKNLPIKYKREIILKDII